MSLSHSSKFSSEKEDRMAENIPRMGFTRMVEGKPEFKLKIYCSSGWSPAAAHMKLTGLSLKLLTVPRTISKYTCRSSSEESSMLGRNVTTHKGIYKEMQFSIHFSSFVSLSTRNPLFCFTFSSPHSCRESVVRAPSCVQYTFLSFGPCGMNTMWGQPLSPNTWSNCLLVEASILATLITPFSLVASLAHSGRSVLQCPHHGAYNSNNHGYSDQQIVAQRLSLSKTITFSSDGPLQTSSSAHTLNTSSNAANTTLTLFFIYIFTREIYLYIGTASILTKIQTNVNDLILRAIYIESSRK